MKSRCRLSDRRTSDGEDCETGLQDTGETNQRSLIADDVSDAVLVGPRATTTGTTAPAPLQNPTYGA
jgi:hypothetical protein